MEFSSMKPFLCLLFVAFLFLSPSHGKPVDYCDKKNYSVKVSSIEINPDPVVRGQPATFSIYATAGEAITSGKLIIDVSYFGFHVHSETHDICSKAKTSCPISAGNFVIEHSQSLPGFTPPGPYTLKMRMLGSDGKQLTCINFDFSIGLAASSVASM